MAGGEGAGAPLPPRPGNTGGWWATPAASQLARLLRRLHRLRAADPVREDLRGWWWFQPPVKPRYDVQLGVSEVAYRYCPTRRDLWLRRVQGARPQPSEPMLRGRVVHAAFHQAALDAMRLYAEGLPAHEISAELSASAGEAAKRVLEEAGAPPSLQGFAERVYKAMAYEWSVWIWETGSPPWLAEWEVDGSLVGLSKRLRVDALAPGLIVEVKYGRWSSDYPVALAGYALAVESSLEIPVDYGIVILVNGDGTRLSAEPVYIGNEERLLFLRARDEAAEIVMSGEDPGRPPACPDTCPFRAVCGG